MATTSLITINEYLEKSFRPDMEYVDGELKERSMLQRVHGRLQILIGMWFGAHEREWLVEAAVEVRTQVAPTRVRLPDVVVYDPVGAAETLVEPPLIVIEILSPDDSYVETQRLAHDYQQMGIQNIWLIDTETQTGRVCRGNDWIAARRFEVAGSPIYMDLDELFARLDRSLKA